MLGAAGCGLIALFLIDPSHCELFPPCPFHALTGFWCPGCGSTRAMYQLAHGHVWAAFQLNPLAVVTIPLLGFACALRLLRPRWIQSLPQVLSKPVWISLLLAVIVAFGILRILPSPSLTWMAP